MLPLQLMITQQGYAAMIAAGTTGTNAVQVTGIGLTASAFVMAPTIDTLPGEFKRLTTVGGQAVAPNIIHMTALDAGEDAYVVRGLGLYLADDTLFAVFAQPTPIFQKVAATTFLLVQDVIFADNDAALIEFGDPVFLNPQATETVKGVAEIATTAEVDAGADDQRIVTPLKLKAALDALALAVNTAIDALGSAVGADVSALLARTISGNGLVTGGGDLSADRVLTVLAASAADVAAGSASDRAVTPSALSGLARALATNGYAVLPGTGGLILQWGRFTATANGVSSKLFPLTFPSECFAVSPGGGTNGGVDSQDNPPVLIESTITASGFSVFSADDTSAGMTFMAVGI